jgi:CRP-like cAMP-binding protein
MVLRGHPIFNELNDGYRLLSEEGAAILVASKPSIQHYKKGQVIINRGDRITSIYSLRDGLACCGHPLEEGGQLTTAFYLKQDIASFMLYSISPIEFRSVSATTFVVWDVTAFKQALLVSPQFSLWFVEYLSSRLSLQHFLRIRTALTTIECLLGYFYWSISTLDENNVRVEHAKVPQEVLASYFSITRSVLNRHKRNLELSGYITTQPGEIVISPSIAYLFSANSEIPAPWERLSPSPITNC